MMHKHLFELVAVEYINFMIKNYVK